MGGLRTYAIIMTPVDDGSWVLKSEAIKVIAEKDEEIRRLKRALYKACSNWARSERYTEATWHGDEHREELWAEVQDKCLKKVKEYDNGSRRNQTWPSG